MGAPYNNSLATHAGSKRLDAELHPLDQRQRLEFAHEMNNTLDGVLRYVQIALRTLRDGGSGDPIACLERSQQGLLRMAGIVRDTMGSKGIAGQATLPVAVDVIVEEAVRSLEQRAVEIGVVISSSYSTERTTTAYGNQLYQVCCNLIKNALEAMPAGGMLNVIAQLTSDTLVLQFEDTGRGLPENVHRIFDPYYTTKNADGGCGLGLTICKQIVEQLKGSITAGQRSGGGAVFSVRIPLQACAQRQEEGK